jgi:hypothetical protein
MAEATEAVGLPSDKTTVGDVRANPADRLHSDARSPSTR